MHGMLTCLSLLSYVRIAIFSKWLEHKNAANWNQVNKSIYFVYISRCNLGVWVPCHRRCQISIPVYILYLQRLARLPNIHLPQSQRACCA